MCFRTSWFETKVKESKNKISQAISGTLHLIDEMKFLEEAEPLVSTETGDAITSRYSGFLS